MPVGCMQLSVFCNIGLSSSKATYLAGISRSQPVDAYVVYQTVIFMFSLITLWLLWYCHILNIFYFIVSLCFHIFYVNLFKRHYQFTLLFWFFWHNLFLLFNLWSDLSERVIVISNRCQPFLWCKWSLFWRNRFGNIIL